MGDTDKFPVFTSTWEQPFFIAIYLSPYAWILTLQSRLYACTRLCPPPTPTPCISFSPNSFISRHKLRSQVVKKIPACSIVVHVDICSTCMVCMSVAIRVRSIFYAPMNKMMVAAAVSINVNLCRITMYF